MLACSSCRKELVQKFQTQFGLLALGNYFGIRGLRIFLAETALYCIYNYISMYLMKGKFQCKKDIYHLNPFCMCMTPAIYNNPCR